MSGRCKCCMDSCQAIKAATEQLSQGVMKNWRGDERRLRREFAATGCILLKPAARPVQRRAAPRHFSRQHWVWIGGRVEGRPPQAEARAHVDRHGRGAARRSQGAAAAANSVSRQQLGSRYGRQSTLWQTTLLDVTPTRPRVSAWPNRRPRQSPCAPARAQQLFARSRRQKLMMKVSKSSEFIRRCPSEGSAPRRPRGCAASNFMRANPSTCACCSHAHERPGRECLAIWRKRDKVKRQVFDVEFMDGLFSIEFMDLTCCVMLASALGARHDKALKQKARRVTSACPPAPYVGEVT